MSFYVFLGGSLSQIHANGGLDKSRNYFDFLGIFRMIKFRYDKKPSLIFLILWLSHDRTRSILRTIATVILDFFNCLKIYFFFNRNLSIHFWKNWKKIVFNFQWIFPIPSSWNFIIFILLAFKFKLSRKGLGLGNLKIFFTFTFFLLLLEFFFLWRPLSKLRIKMRLS